MIKSNDLASPGSRLSSSFQQLHMALGNQKAGCKSGSVRSTGVSQRKYADCSQSNKPLEDYSTFYGCCAVGSFARKASIIGFVHDRRACTASISQGNICKKEDVAKKAQGDLTSSSLKSGKHLLHPG